MTDDTHLELQGKVIDVQKGGFQVQLENGEKVFAKLAGKMRINNIEVLLEDVVTIKVSVYDLSNGLITRRHKK